MNRILARLVVFLTLLILTGLRAESQSWRSRLSPQPTAEEISQAQLFEEPLIATGRPTQQENLELVDALEVFANRIVRDDFSSLTGFLERNFNSPWGRALGTQLGAEYYRVGRYSKAIEAWKRVWDDLQASRKDSLNDPGDRAGAELALMYSRLGRMKELRTLLAEIDRMAGRIASHPSVRGARDGLWIMENRPEVAFRCGPLALDRICAATDPKRAGTEVIQYSESTTNGFSVRQVAELSRQIGMNYQVAFRSPGGPVILPAVVHWKVDHYAALIARDGDLLRADDPTFATYKIWLSDDALDEEASGYFLVRPGPLPRGWRTVSDAEAATVWGKGQTDKSYKYATTDADPLANPDTQCKPAMATWNAHLLLASLHIEDTPIRYQPPLGPVIAFTVSYNQADDQNREFVFHSNVAPEWRINWLQAIVDDPMNAAGDVQFEGKGGAFSFTDYNSTNGTFQNLFYGRMELVRTSTNSYEIRYPDGSKRIFDLPGESIGNARRIYMTAVVDPAGNAATIQYELPGKITSITDAIGQKTKLHYDFKYTALVVFGGGRPVERPGTNFWLVTSVEDPFGRVAAFQVDSPTNFVWAIDRDPVIRSAGWAQLTNVVDPIGINSGLSGGVLRTPYGETRFTNGTYRGLYRANWVEITHPNGEKERVEYSESNLTGVINREPLGIVPKGLLVRNFILYGRNTFHWDRKAYAEGYSVRDYTKAKIYHWTHGPDYATASPILESFKLPHEHRVWFNYPGQSNATFVGSSDQPTKIARTMEDGTTQLYQFEYNSRNKPTKAIDPLGRELTYIYATNDIDLLEVRQTRAGQNEMIMGATYNLQHRPLTLVSAARQTNTLTYNARGQVLTARNARGDTTSYTYDANGYLLAVDGALPGANDARRFTYDSFGRVRTATDDADGYTLTFDYDVLDRLTKVTYPDGTYESVTYLIHDPHVLRDRMGRETRLTYDSLRQLVAVEDPLGRITRFDWCGCGDLGTLIDPLQRATTWLRDFQGRVATKINADGSRIDYGYDTATGWLKSIRDEQNQITLFDYNLDGTLAQKRYFNTILPTPSVRFTYDPDYLRVRTMEDTNGVTTFAYHPIISAGTLGAGRVASIDGPLPNDTITFSYDEIGREVGRGINGEVVSRVYDPAGRLMRLTNALGAFHYGWDGASRRLASIQYPNNQRTSLSYFSAGRDNLLQQITHTVGGSAVISRFANEYANASQLMTRWTQERSGTPTLEYQLNYDAADQLTNATAETGNFGYTYDPAGNRTSEATPGGNRQFVHNVLNEIVSADVTLPNATYEWDGRHQLRAINQGNVRREFRYDGLGRRVRLTESSNGIVFRDRRFVWCQSALCEERDGTGANVLKRFSSQGVRAYPGADIPAGYYFYTRDHLGSVREMTDATGQVRARYDYDPFGRRTRISGDLDADFGFTGHYFLPGANVHLAFYRAYSGNLGRWLSSDPFLTSVPNRYAYVGNNPITYVDPLGLDGVGFLQSINNAWTATRQAFSEAPGPVRWAKEQWEKHTDTGKFVKQIEDFDDTSQKILNDEIEIKEAIDDPDCGHSGARLLDKMLEYLEGVQPVELSPIKVLRETLKQGVENVDSYIDQQIRNPLRAIDQNANDRYTVSE